MIELLCEANTLARAAAALGQCDLDATSADGIESRYRAILDEAFTLLPSGAPPPRRHCGGWNVHQRAAYNLSTRMLRDIDQVLRYVDDTTVPFTNNMAETSLRMVKIHDKVSGTFRSKAGAEAFVTVRSYIQTAAKQGQNRLEVLHQLFTTGPWIPPPQAPVTPGGRGDRTPRLPQIPT
jgi:transposase